MLLDFQAQFEIFHSEILKNLRQWKIPKSVVLAKNTHKHWKVRVCFNLNPTETHLHVITAGFGDKIGDF